MAVYGAVNDTMGFIPFIACKLSAVPQGGQCSTYRSSFGFLDKIGEAGSLFRLCPCSRTTLTILDNRSENHKTFCVFEYLLVTTPFGVPDVDLFFCVTIQI